MAAIVPLFPGGIVPISERAGEEARARQAEAERLRQILLDDIHTSEVYTELASMGPSVRPTDLMPTPDEVAGRWNNGDYRIYDEMQRNVLPYGALQENVINVMTSLPLSWLPGKKGDPDSERAAAVISSAWQNYDERATALAAGAVSFERGFAPLENVWDVQQRGEAKNMISIVAMIDRPLSWFAFDYMHRPYFKPQHYRSATTVNDAEPVELHKVTFARFGSTHSPWGKGTGQRCYPTVWAIHAALMGFMQMTERFGWLPAVVTYPNTWKAMHAAKLRREMEIQWKNVLMIPGEVDQPQVSFPSTDAAYAAANASGVSRLQYIDRMVTWLSYFLRGSQSSSGSQTGSFAREQVADAAQLYQAPRYAATLEAMLNRGYVRPQMLVNFPQLEQSKWPRCVIDTSFGEDLDLLIRIFESGAKLKVPISTVTWSERFKIPLATPGEAVLEQAVSPNPFAVDAEATADDDEPTNVDVREATKQLSDQSNVITIAADDGTQVSFFADSMVYTENRGVVRASQLQAGDIGVVTPEMVRKTA